MNQSTGPIRLLLVDDHAVMRIGLVNMLAAYPEYLVVGDADDGLTALHLALQLQPDVILLDLVMAGMDGIECLKQLRQRCPQSKVLILSSSERDRDMRQTLQAGAAGYVIKTARPQELISAINSVGRGEQYISADVTRCLEDSLPFDPLTSREVEVLQLLRKGMSNPDIGLILGITTRTAKAHMAAILHKLHAQHRAEAVARGFEWGLLKP